MVWSDRLYIGEGIAQTQTALRADIDAADVLKYKKEYVVILALNPANLLELIPVKELAFSYYQEAAPYIVGLAANKGEATELARRIVEDAAHAQGDTDVRRYFLKTA